jgi:sulfonate transport system substrate-binding protein
MRERCAEITMQSGAPAQAAARALGRRLWLAIALAANLWGGSGCARSPSTSEQSKPVPVKSVRVVRPKQLTGLSVLEKQGTLERDLAPLGFSVEWLEFAAGPQQLEALGAGALDIASTAESPPVFAQAAGSPLVYLATAYPSGGAVSLLVPKTSTARGIADLRGKKVAFQKASIGHYLLVRALQGAGLSISDVQSVFLPPADANAAFSESQVDGWFIWEPFVTRAVQNGSGRVLLDGEALRDTANFYTTTHAFADAHPDVLRVFLADLAQAERWSRDHPREMAELLSTSLLIDVPTLLEMHHKYSYGVLPITPAVVAKQQDVADLWFRLGFLPTRLDVRPGFLGWERYESLGLQPSERRSGENAVVSDTATASGPSTPAPATRTKAR